MAPKTTRRQRKNKRGTFSNEKSDSSISKLKSRQDSIFGERSSQFLAGSYSSREEMIGKYEEIFGKVPDAEKLLLEMETALSDSNEKNVSQLSEILAVISSFDKDSQKSQLHYATSKNLRKFVTRLIENGADVNEKDVNGSTPLHIAVKSSFVSIVKSLLFHGAIYNTRDETGKTPSDLSTHSEISQLFQLIENSFNKVKNNDASVIKNIDSIKDIDTVKAAMGAKNGDNQTILIVAHLRKFTKFEELMLVKQPDVQRRLLSAQTFRKQCKYKETLIQCQLALESRKKILGADSPGTLWIQKFIAESKMRLGELAEALEMMEEICRKWTIMFGPYDSLTLRIKATMSSLLIEVHKFNEAIALIEDIRPKLEKVFGLEHEETLTVASNMATLLQIVGRHEEASEIDREIYEIRRKNKGDLDINTIQAHHFLAFGLTQHAGKHAEALEIFEDVLGKKKLRYGLDCVETAITFYWIGKVKSRLNRKFGAAEALREALAVQEKHLTPGHFDTLHTKYSLAYELDKLHDYVEALKLYKEVIKTVSDVWATSNPGPMHTCFERITAIEEIVSKMGDQRPESLSNATYSKLKEAVIEGSMRYVEKFLKGCKELNKKDDEGRTLLHFAVANEHLNVVEILLEEGADITLTTHKGNTVLHTATLKKNVEMIKVLLKHAKEKKLLDFVNAKTTSSGSTALHVAAKIGSFAVVKLLLKHGAIFECKNQDGKTPINLSTTPKITNFLKLTNDIFEDIRSDNLIDFKVKFASLKNNDEMEAVKNARDAAGNDYLNKMS